MFKPKMTKELFDKINNMELKPYGKSIMAGDMLQTLDDMDEDALEVLLQRLAEDLVQEGVFEFD